MKSEIIIPKWVWITGLVIALLGLGIFTSPRDQDNRPLLLLPDVKAMDDYRRSLVAWHISFMELDGRITRLLSANYGGDLFSQSSEGQKIQDATVQLLREVDQTSAPAAAASAKGLAWRAGSAYLEASRALLTWVSAPTAVNLEKAQTALDTAHGVLSELEASQWMAANP
jgi:hypothetical protein